MCARDAQVHDNHQVALPQSGTQRHPPDQPGCSCNPAESRADQDRSPLHELAEFYGMRTEELLPGESSPVSPAGGGGRALRIDLQRLAALPARQAVAPARYAAAVRSQRGDDAGPVLTIRERDLQSLTVVYDLHPDSLTEMLTGWVCWPQSRADP